MNNRTYLYLRHGNTKRGRQRAGNPGRCESMNGGCRGVQHVPLLAVTRHRNLCTRSHLDSRKQPLHWPSRPVCLPSSTFIFKLFNFQQSLLPPPPQPGYSSPCFTSAQLASSPWQCQRLSLQPSPAWCLRYCVLGVQVALQEKDREGLSVSF